MDVSAPVVAHALVAQPLTRAAFAEFGDVIEAEGLDALAINGGKTARFDDLARIETLGEGARPVLSLFHTQPYALPLLAHELERHPCGSQAFVPLDGQAFLVVVAPPGDQPRADAVRAFWTDGRQGVNYRAGVWHHSLLVLDRPSRFVVVDRAGPGPNCDVAALDRPVSITLPR
ncbi:ureidoglycolate lyase [Comamonas serinivorans]|uniref:Ureidoglycolate lyase n=1 Tax=Comamonas serinivorans TaxID=1082851 RepID=A0A1Y0EQR5_9BURK|nr:ureidoglycolate lyase [Comamonas serinivorans]ARU05770.1 ureidoglycolate lyase [Comamonas serinivorans]